MNKNKDESQNKAPKHNSKKMPMARWIGALLVVAQLANIIIRMMEDTPIMKDNSYVFIFIGILMCWLFDEQNKRADKIEAKLDAIKKEIEEVPFEVRRKIFFRPGESYLPEFDKVFTLVGSPAWLQDHKERLQKTKQEEESPQ